MAWRGPGAFEQGHHEISLQCGEQALLPAVREASRDTLVIAKGFSCKAQIEQGGTDRRALHVAQAIKMAREHGPGAVGGAPEEPYYEIRPPASARRRAMRLAFAGGGAAAGVGLAALGLSRALRG